MPMLSRQQLLVLVTLTLCWGLNWPVMKLGVQGFAPLTFRALSIWLGIPVLGLALLLLKTPLRVPRAHWRELLVLALFNMFVWHACIILAVRLLTSGRAAILGYTMPIFSALIGAMFFRDVLGPRAWAGVGAAALGVVLLLSHEWSQLAGAPLGVLLALTAAVAWGLGTQLLRRTRMPVPTLSISFWMTVLTAAVMSSLAWVFERDSWQTPPPATAWAIAYNAVLIFGYAHAAWFYLARSLPPLASTLSVMMIPVIGVFTGAWALQERLFWQDWAAVLLMVVAIACALWPRQASR